MGHTILKERRITLVTELKDLMLLISKFTTVHKPEAL
jgi:hypothetical protein